MIHQRTDEGIEASWANYRKLTNPLTFPPGEGVSKSHRIFCNQEAPQKEPSMWMDELLHRLQTTGNHFVFFTRGIILLGCLRWCRILSIHSMTKDSIGRDSGRTKAGCPAAIGPCPQYPGRSRLVPARNRQRYPPVQCLQDLGGPFECLVLMVTACFCLGIYAAASCPSAHV